jgi:multiple sugar transport system substrate-binding protein
MARRKLFLLPIASLVLAAGACGSDDSSNDSDTTVAPAATAAPGETAASAAPAALSGEITFQTWSLKAGFADYFEPLIAAFEAQNPGVSIKWEDQPPDGYADKVVSQVLGDSLPDVVNLPPDIAHSVAVEGALLDLSTAYPALTSEYVGGALDAYTFSDVGTGVYGFPWYLGTTISYWNTDVAAAAGLDLKDPPTDLDGLIAWAEKVKTASGGKQYLMSRLPGLGDIVDTGTQLVADDGKSFVFNTDAAAAMIDKYAKAYKDGLMPPNVLNNDYGGDSKLYNEGLGGWTAATGSFISNLAKDAPSLVDKTVGTVGIGIPPLFVQGISVSNNSDNPELAIAFAAFVTNAANQIEFTTNTAAKGFFPGAIVEDQSVFGVSDGTNLGDAQVLAYEALQTAQNFTPAIWNDSMGKFLNQEITLAMDGGQSGQDALDHAVEYANDLLAG